MRKLIFILSVLLFASCGKQIQSTQTPSVKNPCDDVIQAILDSIQNVEPTYIYDVITEAGVTDTICIVDSVSCNQIKLMALEIAGKYNTIIKERDYYKLLAQSNARKIINNNYINSKNKNTQIGDENVSQDKAKGPATVGDGNVTPVKPKQTQIGDGNKQDNRKVNNFWLGVLVAFGTLFVLKNALNFVKMYFPVSAPIISMIQKFLPL